MNYLSRVWLVFLFVSTTCIAQVKPLEGSRLNYTLAGFSCEKKPVGFTTTFKIAKGNFTKDSDFEKHVFITRASDSNRALIQLPAFGQQYTWRYTSSNGDKTVSSALLHFSTATSEFADTGVHRLRILKNENADHDLLFFLDYSRVIYNRSGTPVWFLPDIPGVTDSGTLVRDMRATPFGTITFLTDTGAYEIDYDAGILWTGPKPTGRREKMRFGNYHHELKRLSNGNYMLMGSEKVKKKLPAYAVNLQGTVRSGETQNAGDSVLVEYSTVLEYTPSGKLAWTWRSSDYFKGDDLVWMDGRGGFSTSTHMNSFYLDEENKIIYISFRDRNRIVKLRYPDNRILAEYGDGNSSSGNGLFSGQHSCMLDKHGQLYIFNNNVGPGKRDPVSSIQILKEPETPKDELSIAWEFACDIDDQTGKAGARGGNVMEMRDDNFFCCMGLAPRVFIVDKNRRIIFNAIAEKKVNDKWQEFAQYHLFPLQNNTIQSIAFH